jgi:molecular chaperone GrpE
MVDSFQKYLKIYLLMSDEITPKNNASGQNHGDDDIQIEYEDSKRPKKKVINDASRGASAEWDDMVPEDGEGNIQDKVKQLQEKLKKALAEKQAYLDGWQRAKADFVNARKREEESRKEVVKYATEDLVMQLTSVLDSFTMAFANKGAWERVDKNWRVGVEYIYSQLLGVLTQNGFSEFSPMGEPFDPVKHHAVESIAVSDKAQDHKVIEVLQKGYILNGKIIRPASVKIGEYKME